MDKERNTRPDVHGIDRRQCYIWWEFK